MTSLISLGPLLDPAAIISIARHLFSARQRLTLRTGGNLPSATELAIALRLYAVEEDRKRLEGRQQRRVAREEAEVAEAVHTSQQRLEQAATDASNANASPNISNLCFYLRVADVAYALTETRQCHLLSTLSLPPPLVTRLSSSKWSPGYFLVHSASDNTLIIVIRGSKEVSDFITNLSVETEPFLTGHGHQGIIRSAHNVYNEVRAQLVECIVSKNIENIVAVGHSLGAAVAAAVTMLFRTRRARPMEGSNITKIIRRAKCYSFSPPPFLSPSLAKKSENGFDITTIILNLDVVPRLSAASLDRLLYKLSHYDWGGRMINSLSDSFSSFASGILPESTVRSVSDNMSRSGANGIAVASTAIGHGARAALTNSRAGGLWNVALNATAFISELVTDGLDNSRRRLGQENGFAREFGMQAEDIERVLAEGPREVGLAGKVWVIEREFTDPRAVGAVEDVENGAVRTFWGSKEGFEDVQVSGWMLYDHHPDSMLSALQRVAVW